MLSIKAPPKKQKRQSSVCVSNHLFLYYSILTDKMMLYGIYFSFHKNKCSYMPVDYHKCFALLYHNTFWICFLGQIKSLYIYVKIYTLDIHWLYIFRIPLLDLARYSTAGACLDFVGLGPEHRARNKPWELVYVATKQKQESF